MKTEASSDFTLLTLFSLKTTSLKTKKSGEVEVEVSFGYLLKTRGYIGSY